MICDEIRGDLHTTSSEHAEREGMQLHCGQTQVSYRVTVWRIKIWYRFSYFSISYITFGSQNTSTITFIFSPDVPVNWIASCDIHSTPLHAWLDNSGIAMPMTLSLAKLEKWKSWVFHHRRAAGVARLKLLMRISRCRNIFQATKKRQSNVSTDMYPNYHERMLSKWWTDSIKRKHVWNMFLKTSHGRPLSPTDTSSEGQRLQKKHPGNRDVNKR